MVYVLYVPGLCGFWLFFFLMIRRPPRSTLDRSSAASDVYKRQYLEWATYHGGAGDESFRDMAIDVSGNVYVIGTTSGLSLIHISEPTRPY